VTPIQTGLVQLVAGNTVASSSIAADGSYAINTIPPGTYTATITTTGRSLQVQGVVVNAAQLTTANFKFPVHATVRVTVRRDGAPLAGVTIYLQNVDAFASLGVTGPVESSPHQTSPRAFTVCAQSFDNVILVSLPAQSRCRRRRRRGRRDRDDGRHRQRDRLHRRR
jgi:hypothetical protein